MDHKREIRFLEDEKTQLKTRVHYLNLEIQRKDKQMEEIIKASRVWRKRKKKREKKEREEKG